MNDKLLSDDQKGECRMFGRLADDPVKGMPLTVSVWSCFSRWLI